MIALFDGIWAEVRQFMVKYGNQRFGLNDGCMGMGEGKIHVFLNKKLKFGV